VALNDDKAVNRVSEELERWLVSDGPKSIGSIEEVVAEKSFAVVLVLLMVPAALPIPTGGVTLLFQLMAILVSCQMAVGRRTLWLPARWRRRELGGRTTAKTIPALIRKLAWLETHSRARSARLVRRPTFVRFLGVILIAFSTAAALAPPLSGLETLPALGGVVIGLGLIVEDLAVIGAGVVIGSGGIVIFVSVGAALVRLITRVL
jgi:hypothetical protein